MPVPPKLQANHRGAGQTGPYCAQCGQPVEVPRIDRKYLVREISTVFNLERGFLLTAREILLRPGRSIRAYLRYDRKRLMKPVVFVIVCSLIYTLAQQWLRFEDGYVNYSLGERSTSTAIFEWVSKNYGYANLFMAIFIALWLRLFFRKYAYNIFELLVALCFIMGTGMLVFTLFGAIQSMIPFKILDKGFFLGILFICWAIGTIFDRSGFFKYFKVFISYMLGMISFSLSIMLIGMFIDWASK
ncbi:DUF3667 domain-containing protein [Phaeodactylibacter luteus]|uniref:DUF3667 domain-containing protein n=1 Tax=Phaeodactylibacter luteus TaxID=1564516 RepID=A0A5C6RGB6_9BACT|nr:DUF3667 domain-containing protein [Phaeodactylibacter luteus]TXB60547.1 DUF3667 domain-containing protein [Phaeodactylibacter luteus]